MNLIRPSNRPDAPRLVNLTTKVYPAFIAANKELAERVRKREGLVRYGQGAMLMTLALGDNEALRKEFRSLYQKQLTAMTSK